MTRMTAYRCSTCGGNIMVDDEEYYCLACSRRFTLPKPLLPSPDEVVTLDTIERRFRPLPPPPTDGRPSWQRYNDSAAGRASAARYRQSELYKEAHARHRRTRRYKEGQKRWHEKQKFLKHLEDVANCKHTKKFVCTDEGEYRCAVCNALIDLSEVLNG